MTEHHDDFQPRSRSPLPASATDPGISVPPGYVLVHHPGYVDERVMFRFLAYNKNQDGKRWIDYNFALDMCMAMTGHQGAGFFTEGKAPNLPKVGLQDKALLEGLKYFFHVGDDTSDVPFVYPVIRDIRDYVFSPDHVGEHWRTAVPNSKNEAAQTPDACIVTGEYPHAQDAHLVPVTEWYYWKEHGLHKYALQPGPRTQGRESFTRSNVIKLSPTLHTMFDAGHFVLIPVGDNLQCQWIRQSNHMASKLHSRPVRGGCHYLAPELAYLACVYRVIGLMQEEFLERGSKKTVVIAADGQTLEMTGLELGQYREQQARNTSPTKAGSRSGSPRKRTRAPDEEQYEHAFTGHPDYDDVDLDSDSGVDIEGWTRGRRRTIEIEDLGRERHTRKRRRMEELTYCVAG